MTDYYETNAKRFAAATQAVDMSGLRARFLALLPARRSGPARILDAGAGSGRDARAFRLAGYEVDAFDGSAAMARAATAFAELPVRHMRFENFRWEHPFEGIWACASLLHVPRPDLASSVRRLADSLVPDGVLYASFKLGTGDLRRDGRHFTRMNEENLPALLDECPSLRQVEIWRNADRRAGRKDEIWLNALTRKT